MRAVLAYLSAYFVLAVCFTWMASGGGEISRLWTSDSYPSRNAYGELAKAFLHGQLSLLLPVDPALDAAPNPYRGGPYVPAQVYPDLSYYRAPGKQKGAYFAYWGPLPAICLYVPYRLLTHADLSNRLAVLLLILASVSCSGIFIERLANTWLPASSLGARILTFVTVNGGCLLPYLAAFPDHYRVSLLGASVCMQVAFLMLQNALACRHKSQKHTLVSLAAFSTFLALAHMSRATYGLDLVCLFPLLFFLFPSNFWRGDWLRQSSMWQVFGALFIPATLCVCVTLLYNWARFDDPFQFGLRYQMNGGVNVLYNARLFDLKYLSDGLYDYLLAPPIPMDHMPYIAPDHLFTVPTYLHNSRVIDLFTAGVLICFPTTFLALFWPWIIPANGSDSSHSLSTIAGILSLVIVLNLLLAASFWSVCFRYSQDFLGPWMMLVSLFLLSWFQKERRFIPRLAVSAAILVSYIDGFLFGWPNTIFNY